MKGSLAAAVLVVLVLSLAPAAFASTLTVDLNPNTQVAKLTSVSTTHFVLEYPANSTLSSYLKGYNSSSSLSGGFNSTSEGLRTFLGQMHDEADDNVSVTNMTVSYSYSAKANSTALVVDKQTDITAWVDGAFKVSNGTVTADLGWRSFYVSGALDLDLEGHAVDVNLAGSALTQSTFGRDLGVQMLTGMFEGKSLWTRSTLNFSSLSSPLSNWTRSYDSLTNTTTFSKTVAGNSTFTASYSGGGGTYSLTMTSDPSASITTKGYALAAGNSLVFSKAPMYLDPILWVAAGSAVALVALGALYLAKRPRPTAAGAGSFPMTPG
ncbi:MAG TPA: hypothetical protein VGS04_08310 [Nitrososphaerales archaeon]|nr:hypothetical protein [Nitrososphaerales archaeon]